MTNILIFKHSDAKNPADNVSDFVEFSLNLSLNLQFSMNRDALAWGTMYRFTKFNHRNNHNEKTPLCDEFIDFAKAYIKYLHSFNKVKRHCFAMNALKILEHVLIQIFNKGDITLCNNPVLDECARVAHEKYNPHYAVRLGSEFEKLACFLDEHKMVNFPYFRWVNPLRHTAERNWKGYTSGLEGHSKLPDIKSVLAIADIFSKPDDKLSQRDRFTTSVFALLCCAPARISEILSLPEDCEILEEDSTGTLRYGLRFFSVKGYAGDIKWIPTEMVPVAQKAIQRLRNLSEQARKQAKALDEGGEAVHLHNPGQIPADFPWYDREKKIRYSNALCLLNRNQFHARKVTSEVIEKPGYSLFVQDVVKPGSGKNRMKNIFERHGYLNPDGSPYTLRTHQPRHLLNTFAQIAGMDDFSIARWSGRQCLSQNRFYDNRPHSLMTERLKEQGLHGMNAIPVPSTPSGEETDISVINNGAILVSRFGYCQHSYALEPCEHYPLSESGIANSRLAGIHEKISSKARADKNEGFENAQKWCEFYEKIKIKEI